MVKALIFSLVASTAGAQIGRDVIHVAFSLKPHLSADDLRATHYGLLSLVLALGKGQVHRDPNTRTGQLTMRTADFEDLVALTGVEFIAAKATARDAMSVVEYHVRFAEDLTGDQREDVVARLFQLGRTKLIGSVDYNQPLGLLSARIPLANVWVVRSLDGIAAVDPADADGAARGFCEPEIL